MLSTLPVFGQTQDQKLITDINTTTAQIETIAQDWGKDIKDLRRSGNYDSQHMEDLQQKYNTELLPNLVTLKSLFDQLKTKISDNQPGFDLLDRMVSGEPFTLGQLRGVFVHVKQQRYRYENPKKEDGK